MSEREAIRVTVTGRVQGVGYRAAAVHTARLLGLVGWVRNMPDGSVEIHVQGDPDVLERFVAFLEEGPRAARVRSVDARSTFHDPALTAFTVRS